MRIQIIFSIIIILGLQSCFHKEYEKKLENKLEKKFSKRIFRKDNVKKITMHYDNIYEIDTISYYNGYDINNRIINEANRDFYEYDLQGRIIKKYSCFLERDPECNKPVIYNYEYTGKKDLNIKCFYQFSEDSVVNISTETFQYDNIGRLIEHTIYPDDTIKYSYLGNDTLAKTELRITWVEPFKSRVKIERKTTYIYDNLGRKASLTWVESEDNLSTRSDFTYDEKNRLIIQRDTSLQNSTVHQPNSCCLLYWTEFKYDNNNRIIEELHSLGTYDNPQKQLQRKIIYQY